MSDLISRLAVIQLLEAEKPWGNMADDHAANCLQRAMDKVKELPEAKEAVDLRDQLESAAEQIRGDDN